MTVIPSEVVRSPQSMFNSELNMADPSHREEMHRRVFGQNYTRDAKGNPIEMSAMTPDYAKKFPDRAEHHCQQVGHALRGEGPVAEMHERERLGRPISDNLIERVQIAKARRKRMLEELETF